MLGRRAARAVWILEYFAETAVYLSGPGCYRYDRKLGCTSTFDDELDFVDAYAEAFPGSKADPNLRLASRRLRRILNELVDEGLMQRQRLGNDAKETPNDPAWQYIYSLTYRTLERLASRTDTAAEIIAELT